MSKVFKIKKTQMVGLANWLTTQKLDGARSRQRTRFIDQLVEAIKLLEKERLEVIEKYVEKEKDKDGKEVWKKKTGENSDSWDVPEDKVEAFTEEVKGLYAEEYTLSVTAEHKDKIACIKDIVLNTSYVFGVDEMLPPELKEQKFKEVADYNVWCEAFENV